MCIMISLLLIYIRRFSFKIKWLTLCHVSFIYKLDPLLCARSEGTTLLKYKIPTRGLLGLRNAILTASRGTAILNTIFDCYGPWAGDINTRDQGSLVISEKRLMYMQSDNCSFFISHCLFVTLTS